MNKKKSLISNSVFNILYSGLNVLFPMITVMYVSRVLKASGIGVVASAQNIALYFVTFSTLGMPTYGLKEIAKFQEDKIKQSKTFNELFAINMISTIACATAYYVLILTGAKFQDHLSIHLLMGLLVVLNIFNVDWYYQGIEEFKYITIRSFWVKVLLLVYMLFFIKSESDVFKYAVVGCLSTSANYIFNIINIRKHVKFNFQRLNLKKHLQPILMLFLVTVSLEIYSLCDTTMLTFMCDSATVGYYSNVVKLKNIIVNILIAVLAVLMPRLSYFYETKEFDTFNDLIEKGQKFVLLFALPIVAGIVLLAEEIITVFFGIDFLPAANTLRIAAIAMFIIPVGQLLGYRLLVVTNRERKMVVGFFIGAILNVLLNWILIPRYKQNGAMIASVFCELVVASINIYMAKDMIHIKFPIKFLSSELMAMSAMVLTVLFVKQITAGSILTVMLCTFSGAGVFFVVALILKNDLVIEGYNLLVQKIRQKLENSNATAK